MAFPLALGDCSAKDIEAVIPGFSAVQSGAGLPRWSDKTYAQGWSTGADYVPYFTRVCYVWTSRAENKQQTAFIGVGANYSRSSPYSLRTDMCLNQDGTVQPRYEWDNSSNAWGFRECLQPNPHVGTPFPDWLESDGALIMGQIRGNPEFGLASNQTLNLIAARAPRGGGELAIFWVWFLENGVGILFSEGNYVNPLSHNLQVIDYNLFVRNARLSEEDFYNPCGWAKARNAKVLAAHGHFMHIG